MKKILTFLIIILLSINTSLTAFASELEEPKDINALYLGKPSKISIASDAAILIDAKTGDILYQKKANSKRFPASITKIMTVLIALEESKLDEIVTATHDCVYGIESDSSQIYLKVGEKLTMEQSLYAIMLASANDSSWAVADHISGSQKDFAKVMTKKAKELGCKNTNFVNSNGLHNDNHYTTAYDMAIITRAALKNPEFRKIAGTNNYTIPKTKQTKEPRYLYNHHKMRTHTKADYYLKDVEGGKTGYTSMSRNTLVTFAKRGDLELIAVTLKCEGRQVYHDTKKLLEFGFDHYKYLYPVDTADTFNSIDLNNLFNTNLQPVLEPYIEDDFCIVVPNKINNSDITTKTSLNLNIAENTLGAVNVYYQDQEIGSAPIQYKNNFVKTVEAAGIKKAAGTINKIPVIIIGVGAIIVIGIVSFSYNLNRRRRRNRYSRRRRRY